MYLKNIELFGFKSFAEKTTMEFLRGATAIVGPNGCGKSNVSDAIRWVLGEQSAKALRGDEMADVIFNGTDARKPYGMAEVSLTFAECGEMLKTGSLVGMDANYEEVTVTRRIFRDGNSEYFINKTPCRLKDVQSLFMDTGIGRASYSIMEQGKIDKILSAHPEDRRAVFEEAAGITKFKAQKKEALRKLEYTEANLVRVADIIREVKRQIGSLQRQVGKARRYQRLMAEIKHLETQLGRHQFEEIQGALQSLEQEIERTRIKSEEIHREVESAEENIARLREQLNAAEGRRQAVLQRQRDIQSEIERYETRLRTNADRVTETESSIQTLERSISEARARWIESQNVLAANRDNLQNAQTKCKEQAAAFEQAQAACRESEQSERAHVAAIQQSQSALLELEGARVNLRNQAMMLEKQRQELGLRAQKLQGERSIAWSERQKLSQRMESLQTEIQSFKHTFDASRHAVMGGEDALRESENQCQALAAKIAEEQRLLSERTSRRDVLRQLQDAYEGYSEGAQGILRQSDRSAVLGALADFIEVEPRFSTAIEAGLGQSLQSIVVTGFQTALDLVEQLRNREGGRALFAVRDETAQAHSHGDIQSDPLPGALCWARQAVRSQPAAAPFIHQLLADMVIVSDLQQAVALRKEHPGLAFVTLNGDILDHRDILAGGSRKSSPQQLISRRNEIASLESEVAALEARLRELSATKGEWEGRRALARQSLGDRQSELRSQETDMTKKEALVEATQNEWRDLDARIRTVDLEIQSCSDQQRDGELDLERIRRELTETEARHAETQAKLASARQRAEDLAAERHQRGIAANDLRVAHAKTEQQIHGLLAQIQALELQVSETQQFISDRESEARICRQRIVQWQGESAEASQKIESLRASGAGISDELAKIEAEKSALDNAILMATEAVRVSRQQIAEIQKTLTDHEIRMTERRGDLGHLVDRLHREYQVDLASVTLLPLRTEKDRGTESPTAPDAQPTPSSAPPNGDSEEDQTTATVPATISPDRLDFAGWEDVAARVAELRVKIQGMGPVNLDAVQEYEELEQRFAFLTREHDDLALSKEQLLAILQKISVTTRKMFAESFEKIRANFGSVFTELFGGGKADLCLMDESDPLECGIEIMAKPPGKQLQGIMLLSGGERTLTAVALLFAIYMVKPSPFCVLDEMDAPLDESNIDRFVRILERFLAQSQFVIITHNKRTIAMADVLYGVTMEERGISKLVSVKFDHKRNGNGAEKPARSNGEETAEPSAPRGNGSSRLLVEVPPLEEEHRLN